MHATESYTVDKKQLRNAYYKITPNLLFEYQCTSGKFIRCRSKSNRTFFSPELECSIAGGHRTVNCPERHEASCRR